MNRYNNIPIFRTPKGKRYRANVKYPEIPFNDSDFYVIAEQGDRYDMLSFNIMGTLLYGGSYLQQILDLNLTAYTQNPTTK